MAVMLRLWVVLCVLGGCSTASKTIKKERIQAPQVGDLAQVGYYPGQWEMDRCLHKGKQAERVDIELRGDKIVLQRWQKVVDKQPLFTAVIQPGQQTEMEFQSKDLVSDNPVINKTQWSWMDQRIVGSMLWLPGEGDERGNWSAVATGQLFIKKGEPHKMHWVRWGSSQSDRHGQQTWQSECIYRRTSKLVLPEKPRGVEVRLNQVASLPLSQEEISASSEEEDVDWVSSEFHEEPAGATVMPIDEGRGGGALRDPFQLSAPRPARSIEMKIFER